MQVSALFRHPIKSHGRESIEAVTLTQGQTMPWDRTWAVTHENSKFDAADAKWAPCHNFMIGARTPGLAGLWATLDKEKRAVTLSHRDLGEVVVHPDDADDVAAFLDWIAPLCPENRARPAAIVTAQRTAPLNRPSAARLRSNVGAATSGWTVPTRGPSLTG